MDEIEEANSDIDYNTPLFISSDRNKFNFNTIKIPVKMFLMVKLH